MNFLLLNFIIFIIKSIDYELLTESKNYKKIIFESLENINKEY